MRGSRPFSSLRDWLIGLPTSSVSVRGERLELGHQRGAKALRSPPAARAAASRPRRAARRARRRPWRPPRRHRRPPRSSSTCAGGRVVDRQRRHRCVALRRGTALRLARGLEKVAQQRRVVEVVGVAGDVELGVPLHRRDVRRAAAAHRLDHAVVGAAGLDHEARCELLDRLVVDRVDDAVAHARVQLAPGACRAPARCRGSGARRSSRRGARATLGRCVAMSCSSVPPNITLSSCRPRQMPNTGLPARTKASISSIS